MTGLIVRLRALLRRRTADAELDEELRYHLDRETERLVAGGLPTHDARRTASRAFGNRTVHAEVAREAWGWTWLEQLGQDLRYGTRALLRTPTFTAVAVLSLALGIGANTAIFGLLHNLLLQTLPVSHPAELAVFARNANERDQSFSYQEFAALRQVPGLSGITAWRDNDNVPITIGDRHDAMNVQLLDEAFFPTVGVAPFRGRLFSAVDVSEAAPVAVVSASFAERVFGGANSAVGRTIVVRELPVTIIGVTPAAYHGVYYPGYFQVAVPISLGPALRLPDYRASPEPYFGIVGRVADGADRENVRAALDGAFQRCCVHGQPETLALGDMSRGIEGGKDDIRRDYAPILYALMASVVVVLLIACANVGNLLLLRAAAREREIAVRLSLGSSRSRIVRQLLTESVLLGVAGMAAGLVLAGWTTALLIRSLPSRGMGYADILAFRATPAILGVLVLAGLGSVLLFGSFPALRATRPDILASLKAGGTAAIGGRSGVLGRGMVTVQVALALVLVCSASLLVATLRNLVSQDIGVNTANVVGIAVETRGTALEQAGIVPLYPRILQSVQGLPGVEAAGMATLAPLFGGRFNTVQLERADGTVDPRESPFAGVTSRYLAAAGIPLLSGRDFAEADAAGAEPVAIMSRSLAMRRFGRADVVGEIIRIRGDSSRALRVVGVVGDVRLRGPRDAPTLALYAPLAQMGPWPYVDLLVRTSGGAAMSRLVADDVARTAPNVRIRDLGSMREQLATWLLKEFLIAGLASVFGVLALGLASIGLYGVIAYNVARRTNEIGVRMALGASATDVVALVMRHSLSLVGFGVVLGAPLVLVSGKALSSLLYGVGGTDPGPLALSALILVGVALVATAAPALRAARIDPLRALRAE